jgi:TolB-like protein/Tfp pilus assembly protein PilF
MFTDMIGYTSLGQRNESLSLTLVEEQRKLIRPILVRHFGREVKTMGDAFLVEFLSALDAVRCAYDIQRAAREFNISQPGVQRLHLRVGIHLGDIVESEGDISGDAVNLASRIESIAEDGGVCLTRQVFDQIQNKFDLPLSSLGSRPLKNVSNPVEVYKVVMPWEQEKAVPKLDKSRIAVLPFANISPDPDNEYFADGMTEELISTMSRIGGLSVIARTSVMGYKGGQKKIAEIAKELEVGTVLEGSVRKAGDKLRITVQLIDSLSSHHIWAESYDRELKDVFIIQSEIAKTVAEALKIQLQLGEATTLNKKQAAVPEAYTMYLKGRFYWNERTRESVNKAMKYFERAVKVDPLFASAYSGIADCYTTLVNYGWMRPDKAGSLAQQYSTKALEIDETLAEAHASLGLALMDELWEFTSAENELKRAIELRPSYATVYHWYSLLLVYLRRYKEALVAERQALDLDPYSRVFKMGIANILAMLGRTDESLREFDKLIELNPDFAPAYFWKSNLHVLLSEFNEAIQDAKKGADLDDSPHSRLQLAYAYAIAGNKNEAKKILDEVKALTRDHYVRPVQIGLVQLAMGNREEGYEWIEKGIAERDIALLTFRSLPYFEEYRKDPLWLQIDEKLGPPKNPLPHETL